MADIATKPSEVAPNGATSPIISVRLPQLLRPELQAMIDPVPERVALVALGPSAEQYIRCVDAAGDRKAVFDEVWTLNTYTSIIQADRIFHMDDVRVQQIRADGGNARIRNMLKSLREAKVPIYTSFAHPDYPNLVEFPLKEIIQALGAAYFNSTCAYAVAYAMWKGVKKLSCFGMDFMWPDIPGAEAGRACVEYWLGRFHGVGGQIDVAPMSTLMDSQDRTVRGITFYGYDAVRIEVVQDEKDPDAVRMKFIEQPLPSAKEVEEKYDRGWAQARMEAAK